MSGAFAANASALFHEYRISEVHQGASTATGDFVELQVVHRRARTWLGATTSYTYDGGNTAMSTFQFPSNVAERRTVSATILVANDASVTGADFIAPDGLNVVNTDGAACFVEQPRCR